MFTDGNMKVGVLDEGEISVVGGVLEGVSVVDGEPEYYKEDIPACHVK